MEKETTARKTGEDTWKYEWDEIISNRQYLEDFVAETKRLGDTIYLTEAALRLRGHTMSIIGYTLISLDEEQGIVASRDPGFKIPSNDKSTNSMNYLVLVERGKEQERATWLLQSMGTVLGCQRDWNQRPGRRCYSE